jgi:hypothetical protein
MRPAKLRRSRDVSELDPVKIKFPLQIRDLHARQRAFAVRREKHEYAHKVADLIAKSQLTGRSHFRQPLYISSGEHRTGSPVRGICAVTVLLFPTPVQPSKQTRRPRKPTKRISLGQARNILRSRDRDAAEHPSHRSLGRDVGG